MPRRDGPRAVDRPLARDWRDDHEKAAREVLVVVNDASSFRVAADGRAVQRWSPGDFVRSLITCMLRADESNLMLLGLGFPAYSWAVHRYRTPGGIEGLRERAGWDGDADG